MLNLDLSPLETLDDVEVVERKGIGHPDTICDALAETLSRSARRIRSDLVKFSTITLTKRYCVAAVHRQHLAAVTSTFRFEFISPGARLPRSDARWCLFNKSRSRAHAPG